MAYNENLADRVREILVNQKKVEEKKMFGGVAYMVNSKMCVGIVKDDLLARIDPEIYESCLEKDGCREMDFSGKPMKGFVFISTEGTNRQKDLEYWVGLAIDFNKKAKAIKPTKKKSR
jgi:TfoX/Sxy family transcriptional regulator of competence genes